MPNKQRPEQKPRYIDRPELTETFADSMHSLIFDGQSLRLEFVVNRWDEPKPPARPTGRQYPVCRLVLTQSGALDLYNKLHNLIEGLEQQGLIKRDRPVVHSSSDQVQ